MLKQAQYTYKGQNQDVSKSKRDPGFYYEGKNIRITSTTNDTLGSLTVDKGNSLVLTLSNITNGKIIGSVDIANYLIVFVTDDAGSDGIYRIDVDNAYNTVPLIEGNLGFSSNNYIEAVASYENEDLQKVYWKDGLNQLRFINIIEPTTNIALLDIVPPFTVSQPKLESTDRGGLHTSGRIQYTYNLIIKNGQQTALSPISQLISLKAQKGGKNVNEIVGQINNIVINNVDTNYDIIRLYAIKYTSYNQTPQVSLIAEENITSRTFRFSDDGNVIYNTSLSELLFLGGTPIIPGTIESEKNRLILGDITETYFDINQDLKVGDSNYFDTRAFRFQKNATTTTIRNFQESDQTVKKSGTTYLFSDDSQIPYDHDCINDDWTDTTKTLVNKVTPPVVNETINHLGDYKYYFDTSTISLDSKQHYLEISIKSLVGDTYNKSTIITIDAEDVSGINTIIKNTLLSSSFVEGSYKPVAYTNDSVDLEFYIHNPREFDGDNVELDASETFIKIYTTESVTTGTSSTVYKYNSDDYGASGTDIELEIVEIEGEDKSNVLKDNEIYRFFIEFYNDLGQVTPAHWICDLKAPQRNLQDNISNGLKVFIRGSIKLINQGVVGWRLLRVERTDENKTILDQGLLSSSVYQVYDKDEIKSQLDSSNENWIIPKESTIDENISNFATKIPSPLFRVKSDVINYQVNTIGLIDEPDPLPAFYAYSKVNKLSDNYILNQNDLFMRNEQYQDKKFDARRIQPYGEVFSTNEGNEPSKRTGNLNSSLTIQNNKLLQFYSPETVLLDKETKGIGNFNVVGTLKFNTNGNKSWGRKFDVSTQTLKEEIINNSGLSLYGLDSDKGFDLERDGFFNTIFDEITNNDDDPGIGTYFHQNGMIGPTGDNITYIEYQYGRDFILSSILDKKYEFYDSLMYVSRGERNIKYDPTKYTFDNDLKSILIEKNQRDTKKLFDTLSEDAYCQVLSSVNSVGSNSYVFVEGNETPLEDIITDTSDGDAEAIIVELRRTLTNQYGGNTFEARSKNKCIRIGDYNPIYNTSVTIENPGDTFVNTFRFARILPNLSKVYSPQYTSICEIIEFPVESSIDLSARSDESIDGWNSIFHPQHDEYHNYNRVYSQEPIFTTNTPNPFTFDPVKVFNNRINATKVKTSGELVDSWTDLLVNEELYLDGKYGKVQKIINVRGVTLAFQDRAIARLQIQPRVQQLTADGTGVELGTGKVLYNYDYGPSTSSGTIHPRSVFKSNGAVYYVDAINKTINRYSSNGLEGLSDSKGMHSYMQNNLNTSQVIHGNYDLINNDAYFIINNNFVLKFNEKTDSFTDFVSLEDCNILFNSKYGLYSSNDTNTLWKHFTGDYGSYYGSVNDSYITLLLAPNPFSECIYNNLKFKSELYDSNGDDVFTSDGINYTVPVKTIQAYNSHQDTGEITLEYNTNISRLFRDWNLWIPQPANDLLGRMRGTHCFVKLKIDNSNNNRLVLHDIILTYYDNTQQL